MLKMFGIAVLAALVTACATSEPAPARGSTASGAAAAAQMGFHGPLYRNKKDDGPN